MKQQPPTVFVALMLAPNQADLFDEIEAEAADILSNRVASREARSAEGNDLVLLDRDNLRLGLGWASLPSGDALTLAIGAPPGALLEDKDARDAAALLRDVAQCAEALFDVRQTLWQVAQIPLSADSMDDHATRLALFDPDAKYATNPIFIEAEATQRTSRPKNDDQDNDQGHIDVLSSLRDIIEGTERPSWALQASALAMSTAFAIVTPPVGIAMLTYAVLRQGEDLFGAEPDNGQPVSAG
ncbi:MAG: hypothetical protein ABJD13_15285 [Paracoccaceae bacterium]